MSNLSLRNYWHPLAKASEVTETPTAFTMLGEQLVAFRAGEAVRVFKDLCIHRGAAFSAGGVVKDGNLVCPYHGWTYDGGGVCVRIPSLMPGQPIPEKARVTAYQAREEYGLVWVCLAEPAMPFPVWPDNAWGRDDYRVFLVDTYDWNASAGRVVENALDMSHFNFVHVGYTELADGPVIKPYEVTRTERGLTFDYNDGHLLREYTLEYPFLVHDRKGVVNPEGGKTWSELGQEQVRRRHAAQLSCCSAGRGENSHLRVRRAQPFARPRRFRVRRRLWDRDAAGSANRRDATARADSNRGQRGAAHPVSRRRLDPISPLSARVRQGGGVRAVISAPRCSEAAHGRVESSGPVDYRTHARHSRL